MSQAEIESSLTQLEQQIQSLRRSLAALYAKDEAVAEALAEEVVHLTRTLAEVINEKQPGSQFGAR